jgi:hypothetical protein
MPEMPLHSILRNREMAVKNATSGSIHSKCQIDFIDFKNFSFYNPIIIG